ncbi:hypothetical protein LEP1GSC203_0529 [Leptospira terpstrae serovar Hualin str. LT 11-33 = ATCC 700639]|uniref:Uncharacterized protein n=1 Tax=Leptospira terpstrae serovar Hualin str. LT 11-33 = ATCC 700639 TaxID=1257025 RepID=N1VYS3_9LEPT|nr:hypothetical protein LEP1GSC203_0529 [Leptospira terpstrae serovar Hualin str. LT 11-33 = ATCC 700639]
MPYSLLMIFQYTWVPKPNWIVFAIFLYGYSTSSELYQKIVIVGDKFYLAFVTVMYFLNIKIKNQFLFFCNS